MAPHVVSVLQEGLKSFWDDVNDLHEKSTRLLGSLSTMFTGGSAFQSSEETSKRLTPSSGEITEVLRTSGDLQELLLGISTRCTCLYQHALHI